MSDHYDQREEQHEIRQRANQARKREFLGKELPQKGRWVQVDPAKFTIDMFPIVGKGSNEGIVWDSDELIGYYLNPDHRPFICNSGSYKHFQIWEAE